MKLKEYLTHEKKKRKKRRKMMSTNDAKFRNTGKALV
jgi:hypothetical protein